MSIVSNGNCQIYNTDKFVDTTLCDKVCQWLATDLWFSLVLRFSPPIKLAVTI
jgi:hypothetical protein